MSLTKVTYSMISGAVFNVLDYGASPSATAAVNTAAINATITAAVAAGGGTVYIPTGTYLTNAAIVVKTNINLLGDGPFNSIIRKTAAYAGVSAGTISPSVPCRTFSVVGIGMESQDFGGNGFDFQDCAYFNIDNLSVTRDAGKGISIRQSFIGNVGTMYSTRCDWNFYFFGVQSVQFDYLYGSTPTTGSNNIGCEITACKTLSFNSLVTEGNGKYGLLVGPVTSNIVIQQWYFETGTYTSGGVINALSMNGDVIGNSIQNFQIKSATVNCDGITTASPLIAITNSVIGLVLENFRFSLGGAANYSTTPISKFNINNTNADISGPRISNWTTVDATTGSASTTWHVWFVDNTPDARIFNTITTKASQYSQYDNTRILPDTNAFQLAGSPIVAGLVPKWIGDFCQDSVANRMYIANTTTAGDWTLI
jgi:hypothetical protein